MTAFNDREKAEESKYAREEELQFKITARRNKLLGLWAAEKMHYDEEKAEEYSKEIIISDFEEVGEEDVLRKVKKDFAAAGLEVSEHEIREQMYRLMEEARKQVVQEN